MMSKLKNANPSPIYETFIPSTGKKIKFRPFYVREERALMAAQESDDLNVMLNTLDQVVENCIMTPFDEELATFDIEYLFIQIRSKSVGEESRLIFTCQACSEKTAIDIQLKDVYVKKDPDHNANIKLSDTLALKMKYPTIEELTLLDSANSTSLGKQLAIVACIDSIYKESEIILASDEDPVAIMEFIDTLTSKQYALVENFLNSIPETRLDLKWKCPKCGHSHDHVLRGINSVF